MPYQGREPVQYPDSFYRTYQLEAGTESSPSIKFENDTNNGIWSPALDNIAISTNGSQRLTVNNVGQVLVNHGTATNIAGFTPKLQLQGTTFDDATISLTNNAGNNTGSYLLLTKGRSGFSGGYGIVSNGDNLGQIRFHGADGTKFVEAAYIWVTVNGVPGPDNMPGRLFFSTNSGANLVSEKMCILPSGNVGIGTSSPSEKLHVANGNIFVSANSTIYSGGDLFFRAGAGGKLRIGANNVNDMVILDTAGRVGIGTSAPARLLSISDQDNATIRLTNTRLSAGQNQLFGAIEYEKSDASGAGAGVVGGVRMYSGTSIASNAYMTFSTSSGTENDVERVRIDPSGNVGIGTSTPSAKLQVYGNAVFGNNTTAGRVTFLQTNLNGNAHIECSANNELTLNGYSGVLITNSSGNTLTPVNSTSGLQFLTWNRPVYFDGYAQFGGEVIMRDLPNSAEVFHAYMGDGTGGTSRKVTFPNGNVGIGVTSPSSKLSVNGYITESTDGTNYWNVVTQQDIGTAPNQVPLNQYLGSMAYQDSTAISVETAIFNSDILINGLTVGRGTNNESTNTALGVTALSSNTTGYRNTAIGQRALQLNTTGVQNTAIGRALELNVNGSENTAVGRLALYGNISGNYNVAIGNQSLSSNTVGTNNTCYGYLAGSALTTGSNNTIIGNAQGTAGLSDTVIISAGPTERLRITSTGQTLIGTTSTTQNASLVVASRDPGAGIYVNTGSVGGGTSSPSYGLYVEGQAWTNATIQYGVYSKQTQQYVSPVYGGYFESANTYSNSYGVYAKSEYRDSATSINTYGLFATAVSSNANNYTTNLPGIAHGAWIENTSTNQYVRSYGLTVSTASGPYDVVPFRVLHGGGEKLRLDSSGRLLLGTTASTTLSGDTLLSSRIYYPAIIPANTSPVLNEFSALSFDNLGTGNPVLLRLHAGIGGTPNGRLFEAFTGLNGARYYITAQNYLGSIRNDKPFVSTELFDTWTTSNAGRSLFVMHNISVINGVLADGVNSLCASSVTLKPTWVGGTPSYRNATGYEAIIAANNPSAISTAFYADVTGASSNWAIYINNGDAAKPGGGSFTATSDSRVKNISGNYTRGLSEICELNPVKFTYNGKAETPIDNKERTGLIAQEVKEIIPEIVSSRLSKLNEADEEAIEIMMVDPSDLVFALINACKELQTEIATLKTRLDNAGL